MKKKIFALGLLFFTVCQTKAQESKRHTFTVGVLSRDAHQEAYPGERINFRYSNYLSTFGYAYSFYKHLKARIRFKKIDYVHQYNGGFTAETSRRNGFEIGVGGLYGVDLGKYVSLYTGVEAVRNQSWTIGEYFTDVPPYQSKVSYQRRTIGGNVLLGGEIRVHPQFSVVIESR